MDGSMDFKKVIDTLESVGTDQNIKIYRRHGAKRALYGVSFANFKKIKKQITSENGKKGFNQSIAEQLWLTDNTDAQILACMIAEPSKITKEVIWNWSKSIDSNMISNPFADLIYGTPYKEEFIKEWLGNTNDFLGRVPFNLISLSAKNSKETDDYFVPYITYAEKNLQHAKNWTKESMNNCLIAIGGRNDHLKERVFKAADLIGLVEIDHGETSCKTFDIKDYVNKIHLKKQELANKRALAIK